nr:MAG TPA: hypothetical protein [Caudoviricetes sp.]
MESCSIAGLFFFAHSQIFFIKTFFCAMDF